MKHCAITVASVACLAISMQAVGGQEKEYLELDHNDFDENSIVIDNEWWPLTPGKQLVYEGITVEDGEEVPHRIVFTVTDLTKVINGVNAVVIWDRDFSDGILEESELAFYAQAKDGNIWHLGQYREEYEAEPGGEFIGGRAWMIGHLDGAKAGIMMPADPQLGQPSYSQGFAPPPYYWTDRAQVAQVGVRTEVPAGNFDDVIVIDEWNLEEPGAIQTKYYARGVGNVRVGWKGDDPQQEELELVAVINLSPAALAEVRAEALKLEVRAYTYATTEPAKGR